MNFKKYMPFIIVIVIAIIFVGGVFIIRTINQPATSDNGQISDQSIPDLPQDQRPTAELIPTPDGHYLNMNVTGIKVPGAVSMDYEVVYKADNNGNQTTQGVPGTIPLNGATSVNRKLLLGSESSGKFRYDQGVQNGTLTLRFRDGNGKLLGKVATDWHFQTGTTTLTSVDGSFKYTLNSPADGVWFITMQTFGTPSQSDVVTFSNGWAVFASDGKPHPGK